MNCELPLGTPITMKNAQNGQKVGKVGGLEVVLGLVQGKYLELKIFEHSSVASTVQRGRTLDAPLSKWTRNEKDMKFESKTV